MPKCTPAARRAAVVVSELETRVGSGEKAETTCSAGATNFSSPMTKMTSESVVKVFYPVSCSPRSCHSQFRRVLPLFLHAGLRRGVPQSRREPDTGHTQVAEQKQFIPGAGAASSRTLESVALTTGTGLSETTLHAPVRECESNRCRR